MHFNQLSPGEAERLAMLAEEAGEVAEAAGAALATRGIVGYDPDAQERKAMALQRELCDLLAIFRMMEVDIGRDRDDVREDMIAYYSRPERCTIEQICKISGSLVQAVMKILRHGYHSYHPAYPERGDNRVQLAQVVSEARGLITAYGAMGDLDAIVGRKLRYTHHQDQAA